MPLTEIRRFLHVNYNCRDVDNLERFYEGVFGLRTVMRTDSDGDDGSPFGMYVTTTARTVFMYDHRGGRRSSSMEFLQWTSPPTCGSTYPQPWFNGIQSVAYSVADLDATAAAAVSLGGTIARRGDGWMLLHDPEGVWIEVLQADGPSEGRYVRIVVSDIDKTAAWWAALGFEESPLDVVDANEMWPTTDDRRIVQERSMVGTDDSTFGIILTRWSGPQPMGPTYALPYHQGLYRMALAVDDIQETYQALQAAGVALTPPYTFQLPGTKLTDGLTILFIREPDNIMVELVGRPNRIGRT